MNQTMIDLASLIEIAKPPWRLTFRTDPPKSRLASCAIPVLLDSLGL